MTSSPHSINVEKYHQPLRKAIELGNFVEVDRILCELETVCRTAVPADTLSEASDGKPTASQDELTFWLKDVARLMLEGKSASTRRLALSALESAVPHLIATNYQELPVWTEMRINISRDYTSLLDTARSEKDPHWHRMWSLLVRIMNRELCQGSSIINMFLSIVEAGFRSPDLSIREQSFDCWRLLVEVFAYNKQINLPKRVKLICIPLKSSKSKTEMIALKKFDIWWFLLSQLRPQLDGLADTIFEPFIYFCFGPSFKPPLCYYFDDAYQEYGAPGKIYQAIKQLSALALIHLLGPAPEVSKTLLLSDDASGNTLSFDFPKNGMTISALLFSTKAKLLIDACIECTVLFAQMKHLNYLDLNRCLWGNLMERINVENTVPKNELLQRIKEDTNALLRLCIKRENDVALRELLYDTLLIIAKSDLLTVNIGYDSPEQPMLNYKSFMSAILHPELPCPDNKSEEIIKHVFGLQRYSRQNGYWEMLQKTIQYLSDTDGGDSGSTEFRTIRTQIYCHLGTYLIVQIRDDPAGLTEHQSTVMNFLLYPLEYDQLVLIDSVKGVWDAVYEPIALRDRESCEFTNTFCEMIKAMTIAKFAFNLKVVADFFCTILRSLSVDFDPSKPPMKVFELFKDLTRKAQAYQAHLDRVESMVSCFRELLEVMSIANMLTLILPIRNAINEIASNEKGLAMDEVQRTLSVLASKMASTGLCSELVRQPKEVRWNCKMLLNMMLDLPVGVKAGWKLTDMKRCMDICDGKEARTPTRKKPDDEFVVIQSNWQFKPEVLTEHQREKMMEKRTDIPALYNDMSQSQDSFVIKPWTPSKAPSDSGKQQPEALGTEVVSSTADTLATEWADSGAEKPTETVIPDSETVGSTSEGGESIAKLTRLDKENNHGNVAQDVSAPAMRKKDQTESDENQSEHRTSGTQHRRAKKRSILEQLRIDTVEGKTLDVMSLTRTRGSDVPPAKATRRKSLPTRKVESEQRRGRPPTIKREGKSASVSKATTSAKDHPPPEARSSRKLLNFENIECDPADTSQSRANVSDEVIESSQTPLPSQSLVARKVSLRKSRAEDSASKPAAAAAPAAPVQTEPGVDLRQPDNTMDVDETEEAPEVETEGSTSTAEHAGEHMEVDRPVDVTAHDEIVPESAPAEEKGKDAARGMTPLVARSDTTNAAEGERAEESAPGSGQMKESSVVPMSPSRRCTLLPATESNVEKGGDGVSATSETDKSSKETRIHTIFPRESDVSDKETPSKLRMALLNSPVRAALQLLNSPRKNLATGAEQSSGLGGPKVALYSPLVVLEPIRDYPALVKGDAPLLGNAVKDAVVPQDAATGGDRGKAPCEEPPLGTAGDQLSPAKNLDAEMEPLNKSLNCSIVSSPDLAGAEERNADLLNSTLNISPIVEDKGDSVRAASSDGSVLSGSADRRSSSRTVGGRDRESLTPSVPPTMVRRSKLSPSFQGTHGSNPVGLKLRTPQLPSATTASGGVMGTPRSPSTNMINLGGRGAQLINLIRSQHSDHSPKPNTPPPSTSTPQGGGHQSVASANRLMMRKRAIAGNAASGTHEGSAAGGEEHRDSSTQYLVFSKVLPSPQASPASGILKRRHNLDDTGDDIESPMNKRKRVSFHDPPVSITKEYIRQVEECRSPSVSRCLQLATSMSSADKAKYMMRRRSTSDSISELQNFTKNHDGGGQQQQSADGPQEPSNSGSQGTVAAGGGAGVAEGDEEELTSSPESLDDSQFMIHDATDAMAPLQVTTEFGTDEEHAPGQRGSALGESGGVGRLESGSSPQQCTGADAGSKLRFPSEDVLLEHVMSRYTLDDLVERYLAAGRTLEHSKTTVRLLTKELSTVMSNDAKARHLVLDELSERHPVEFLEHALQENSSATVCERLSLTAMIDHIFKHLTNFEPGSSADKPSSLSSTTAVTGDEKDHDALRLVDCIYEKLANLPDIESHGQTVAMLRDRFLRLELARKSRMEVMALLEGYFKTA